MGACISIDEETLQIQCGTEVRKRHREKKKIVMEVLSAEAKVCELLCQMPGRIYSNGVGNASCLFTKQGQKGINQDCMLVWEDFAAQANTVFCGVFDGHGPNGHLVARKVRDSLPSLLALPLESLVWSAESCNGNAPAEDEGRKEKEANLEKPGTGTESDMFTIWKEKFVAAYEKMDHDLKRHPKLNSFCSGTTSVTMVVQDKDLVIANVGDSRAVLARTADDGSVVADQLTVDLKPNLPGELERIRNCKGRVFALEDEPQVARMWLPNANTPGLAMARALGDFCLKDYGLSSLPEVSYRRLTEKDEFVVLATDGVWDVLSNEEVVAIVGAAFPNEAAAKSVVDAAVKRWRRRQAFAKTDDCAVVCHFFKEKLTPSKNNVATCNAIKLANMGELLVSSIDYQLRSSKSSNGESDNNGSSNDNDNAVLQSYETILNSVNHIVASDDHPHLDRGV